MVAVDAVLFDLDNTLCVHDQDDEEIHRRVFERAGIDPFFEVEDLYALAEDDIAPADSLAERYENMYRVLAADAGTDTAHARPLAEATVDVIDYTQVSFRTGAERALERARERCRVGLVTNGTRAVQTEKLASLGIRDAFDAEVYCGPGMDVPGKPDPAPLQRALDELGVTPDRALKVGDSLELDVAGARNAGTVAVWVPMDEPDSSPHPAPDHVLGSMREFPNLL